MTRPTVVDACATEEAARDRGQVPRAAAHVQEGLARLQVEA